MNAASLDGIAAMAGPFGAGYKQTHRPILSSPPPTTTMDSILSIAQEICSYPSGTGRHIVGDKYSGPLNGFLLSPTEIQQFLNHSVGFDTLPSYADGIGFVASRLIGNAYNNNVTSFSFDLTGIKPLRRFASHLPKRDTPLEIIVRGKLDIGAFIDSVGDFYCEELLALSGSLTSSNLYVQKYFAREKGHPPITAARITTPRYSSYYFLYPGSGRAISTSEYEPTLKNGLYTADDEVIDIANSTLIFTKITKIDSTRFNKLWQPAVAGLKRLDELFGDCQ